MAEPAIKVEHIGKQYVLGGAHSANLRETLTNLFKSKAAHEYFWALNDVSFEVPEGEILGIIGKNGAGKSTLLKILSRITYPTKGRFELCGRVGSLLEVGTGFHPELTGRENIFINGTILGMSRKEVKAKFDEIVDFSGVEKFIDTPVKHYSSGMFVRLAFAVAAHLNPEILIIDEVLAVGDIEFQKKCLGKMDEVSKTEGRTVLFVSHNMTAVRSLCQRVVLLEQGNVKLIGDPEECINHYMGGGDVATHCDWPGDDAPGNEHVRIRKIITKAAGKTSGEPMSMTEALEIYVEFEKFTPGNRYDVTLQILDDQGTALFATGSGYTEMSESEITSSGTFGAKCFIPGNFLNQGRFYGNVLIVENKRNLVFKEQSIFSFDIVTMGGEHGWMGRSRGGLKPLLDWEMGKIK